MVIYSAYFPPESRGRYVGKGAMEPLSVWGASGDPVGEVRRLESKVGGQVWIVTVLHSRPPLWLKIPMGGSEKQELSFPFNR